MTAIMGGASNITSPPMLNGWTWSAANTDIGNKILHQQTNLTSTFCLALSV